MAKLQLFPKLGALETVTMTQLRPHLREVVAAASTLGVKFLITHHGKQVAAIVSVRDMWRIWEDEELEMYGPKNPKTGRRPGGNWIERTGWQRHVAVEWTENGPVVLKDDVAAIPLEEGEAAEEKAERPGRWWRFW